MTQLKYVAIIFGVFMLILAGSIVYSIKQVDGAYDKGFTAGQQSIKPTSSQVDTVRDTVWVKPKSKPTSKPIAPKDTSLANELIASLQNDKDSLQSFIINRLSPKQFLVSDPQNRALAVVNYNPITDEYDGYVELTIIEKDSNFVKEGLPCPDSATKGAWYKDASIYAAGGATGVLVIASGGSVLLGLGITVGVSAVIAIF